MVWRKLLQKEILRWQKPRELKPGSITNLPLKIEVIFPRYRHQSLGDPTQNPLISERSTRNKLQEASRSLDSAESSSSRVKRSRSRSRHLDEDDLPPAPPPPNCSPRNSDGKASKTC